MLDQSEVSDLCSLLRLCLLLSSIYTVFRTIGPFILGWKGEMVNPLEGLSLMTPVKLGLWHIALDFWFYLYHRSCHEFDSIWWIHRQHHATKHPTPILS